MTLYYVSPTGNDAAPGTVGKPFKTLNKGAAAAKLPGDTVIVGDGVYTATSDRVIEFWNSGTAEAPITFKAMNKWGAVIDGQNFATTYGAVFSGSYINFQDFDLRKMKNGALWMQGTAAAQRHHITVSGCWIHDIARVMLSDCADGYGRVGGYTNGYCHHITWDHNVINNVGRIPNLACDASLGSGTHNYRHDHGLYLQGKYHTVSNNFFYNMVAGWAIKVDGFFFDLDTPTDASHTIINNTFAFAANPGPSATGHIRIFANSPPDVSGANTMRKPVNVLIADNTSLYPPAKGGDTFVSALYEGQMYYTGTKLLRNFTTAGSVIEEAYAPQILPLVTLSGNQVGIK